MKKVKKSNCRSLNSGLSAPYNFLQSQPEHARTYIFRVFLLSARLVAANRCAVSDHQIRLYHWQIGENRGLQRFRGVQNVSGRVVGDVVHFAAFVQAVLAFAEELVGFGLEFSRVRGILADE